MEFRFMVSDNNKVAAYYTQERINQEWLEQLKQACPQSEILIGKNIPAALRSDYVGQDVGLAAVYVKVSNSSEVQQAVKWAHEHAIAVTVRAGGTNLVGSTIPIGGMVLDVSGLNRILDLDEENRTLLVEPGVKLCDLQAFVESKGLFYPPDPAEKQACIGGNISTNAGGMRAVKYGVTRDFVLGLEVVLPDGTLVNLGSSCLKDTTGLNLKHLFIGAEGTLGVITKCLLKLIAKPEATEHALVGFKSLQDAICAVNVLQSASLIPTAIEFVEKKVIAIGEDFLQQDFPLPHSNAYLMITFDGKSDDVTEKLQQCNEVLAKHYDTEFLILKDPQISSRVWEIRAALAKAVQASGIWEPVDTVVPLSSIAEFVDYVSQVSLESGLRILAFGHAGDGNVHLCILKDQLPLELWPERLDEVLNKLYHKVYQLQGKITAEHGIGRHKRKYFLQEVNSSELLLMRKIKSALDPHGLFNPHSGYTA